MLSRPAPVESRQVVPRIAYCTDTFEETNGVATLSRAFAAYARRERLPVLLIRPGRECRTYTDGSVTIVEVAKSAICLPLDMGLRFDLLVFRKAAWLREQMNAFHPDIVHITGPGDIGMVCARLAHVLRVPKPPLVAAWHTNLHQYARLRATPLLRLLPESLGVSLGAKIEANALRWAARFYRTARLILAPNEDILGQLMALTGKPGRVLPHGVDAGLFTPAAAPFDAASEGITLGYVGRLTTEKNVRFLAELANRLPGKLKDRARFLIVGDGAERRWLEQRLPRTTRFTGVLRAQDLAAAFASMDVFLFPSLSDTFGLVVLEAMAAGVPVVSFDASGPKSAIDHGINGYVVSSPDEFAEAVGRLGADPELRRRFSEAARSRAVRESWDAVFSSLYDVYASLLDREGLDREGVAASR